MTNFNYNSRYYGSLHQTLGLIKSINKLSSIFDMYEKDLYEKVKLYQLHALSRTQQGRQREPGVKIFRSPLSAEFWRHCVLSSGTQRCALPRHQGEEMKI